MWPAALGRLCVLFLVLVHLGCDGRPVLVGDDASLAGDVDQGVEASVQGDAKKGAGYLLWQAPGGKAGTGPALEVRADGTVRFWKEASTFNLIGARGGNESW